MIFPTTDDLERSRNPPLALSIGIAGLLGAGAALLTGAGWAALALLACALFGWVFAAGAEANAGAAQVAAVTVAGAGAMILVARAAGHDERLAVIGAAGAVSALVLHHVVRFRGARVLSLVLVPLFAGFVELPAWGWALAWAVLLAALAALGAFGS